jgi:hypothetical protein
MDISRDRYGKIEKKPLVEAFKSTTYAGKTTDIQFGRNKCKFLSAYPPQLDKALSAPFPGFQFTQAFKNKTWDGQHHFITRAGYFPTGLLPLVIHILSTGNNPLIEEDKRGYKVLKSPVTFNVTCDIKDKKLFYSAYLSHYNNSPEKAASTLNTEGVFAYPIEIFRSWAAVRDTNPLATQILALAKSLHQKKA